MGDEVLDQEALREDVRIRSRFNRGMHRWEELPALTWELDAMIGDQGSSDAGDSGVLGGSTGSRAPWNSRAAMMFFEIHAEIRRVESMLTLALDHRAVYRGGSNDETRRVLDRLPVLLEAMFSRDPESAVLAEALHLLAIATSRARVMLRPETRQTRAPWVTCHVCEGRLWIYAPGHDVNPRIDSEHFLPGAAYCNRCAVFYPEDIWVRVAKENGGA